MAGLLFIDSPNQSCYLSGSGSTITRRTTLPPTVELEQPSAPSAEREWVCRDVDLKSADGNTGKWISVVIEKGFPSDLALVHLRKYIEDENSNANRDFSLEMIQGEAWANLASDKPTPYTELLHITREGCQKGRPE